MKSQIVIACCASFLLVSCDSEENLRGQAKAAPTPKELIAGKPETRGNLVTKVELTNPLNAEWVTKGQATYELKCLACHKLDETKVVGPGWKGLTARRKPEWIMNMVLNVDTMLDSDEEAQKLLELCLVRMPNQNLTEPEAREVLEFMRSNDGEK